MTFRVQRNSVPSTQMRCMITANRRASATIAFFIPALVLAYNLTRLMNIMGIQPLMAAIRACM
jgi:hypothetical protein